MTINAFFSEISPDETVYAIYTEDNVTMVKDGGGIFKLEVKEKLYTIKVAKEDKDREFKDGEQIRGLLRCGSGGDFLEVRLLIRRPSSKVDLCSGGGEADKVNGGIFFGSFVSENSPQCSGFGGDIQGVRKVGFHFHAVAG